MQTLSLWVCILALFASSISATALTYKMQPNEKACFFTDVAQKGAKIAFYFAVYTHFVSSWVEGAVEMLTD